jgi:hypothetical protein
LVIVLPARPLLINRRKAKASITQHRLTGDFGAEKEGAIASV